MKYIITESRLENFLFQYLDNKFDGIEPMKGKYSDIVFGLPGETYGVMDLKNQTTCSLIVIYLRKLNLCFQWTLEMSSI